MFEIDPSYPMLIPSLLLLEGVIRKPCGQIFGDFLPPPPLWTILLNKAYVDIWTFDIWTTWFMNDPELDTIIIPRPSNTTHI